MKRTRELTAIHYRRSIKRPVTPSTQNVDLQHHCPFCGTPLAAIRISDSADKKGVTAAQEIISPVVQKRPGPD